MELVILRECEASPGKGKGLRLLQSRSQPDGNNSCLFCRGEDNREDLRGGSALSGVSGLSSLAAAGDINAVNFKNSVAVI